MITIQGKRNISVLSDDSPSVINAKFEYEVSASTYHPLYITSNWVEPRTMTKVLTVFVLLPLGVFSGQFSIQVSEDGNKPFLVVTWPDLLIDLKHIHRKWLRQSVLTKSRCIIQD